MDYRRTSTFQQRRSLRKGKKKRATYLWLVIFMIIGIFYYSITNNEDQPESLVSPDRQSGGEVAGVLSTQSTSPGAMPYPSPSPVIKSKSLQEAIEKSLEGTTGSYGVFVKNLKTGESFSLNENKVFDAGSLYKLWTMAVVFNEIEKGNLEEDEELSQAISVLNRKFGIDPALAEQTQGTITLTVRDALKQMITISHNYAALLLTEKIKLSTVAAWLEEKSFTYSKVGTDGSAPSTTPLDIALFYEKLYKGELANEESTARMFELLKAQQINHKLPQNLPKGTVMAHKTGELGWFSHDAGIVYTEKGDYLIVAMSESPSPKGAEERIATLSETIFNYFKNKK